MTAPIQVPGAGALSQHERELTARVHIFVTIEPDTIMVKALPPGALQRYLNREVSPGAWGSEPPFDYRVVGGTVVRAQDVTELHTPADFMRALRLDYPGSPFMPDVPVLDILEFRAVAPNQYIVPLGAPTVDDPRNPAPYDSDAVREVAWAMADAAEAVGLDPNVYRKQINPWPYTGTGITADPELGVPERWRRYDPVPGGATIFEYNQNGMREPVAVYRGEAFGWEPLR
jgi:hypothetical protein